MSHIFGSFIRVTHKSYIHLPNFSKDKLDMSSFFSKYFFSTDGWKCVKGLVLLTICWWSLNYQSGFPLFPSVSLELSQAMTLFQLSTTLHINNKRIQKIDMSIKSSFILFSWVLRGFIWDHSIVDYNLLMLLIVSGKNCCSEDVHGSEHSGRQI